jgi:pimeloyl-ACP methyl ester carboxylesterase
MQQDTGIWYADHRDPTVHRTPTIMIHGAGSSHLDWPAELRRMAEANAIAPDLPGHGKSSAPGHSTLSAYAASVIALMDRLKLARAVLLGHSMGGAIAQLIALNYPDRAAGLVLVATGAQLNVNPAILTGLRADFAATVTRITGWQWADGYEQQQRLSLRRQLETNPDVYYSDFRACASFDVRDQLGRLRVPTLVIGGTHDRMTPFRQSEELRDLIPGARLAAVEGGGHMLLLEQPQVAADLVRGWLLGVEP